MRICWGVLLLLLAGCASSTSERVVIGQVVALTGSEQARGQSARQGAALAAEELNEQQSKRQFTVLHADSQSEPEVAVAQAARLAAVNRVALVLSGTGTRNPAALAAQTAPHGVPLLTAAEIPPFTDSAFSATASPDHQGQVLGHFATENLKADKAVVLTDSTSPVSLATGAAFVREFHKGKATVEERSFKSEPGWPELVNRLKETNADAVLFAGSPRQLLVLRTRLHEMGVDKPLLFGGVEGSRTTFATERGPGGSVYFTTVYAREGLTPAGQEFARKYQERHGQEPDANAALAYDNLRLVAHALAQLRGSSGQRLRDELAKIEEFESVTGPMGFTPGHSARRAVFVLQLQDGGIKLARRFDAEPK